MEAVIGNYAKPTFDATFDYDEFDPYNSLLYVEGEIPYDDKLDFHTDSNGQPLSKPNADDYLAHDAPFKESSDEHIGLQVTLPH